MKTVTRFGTLSLATTAALSLVLALSACSTGADEALEPETETPGELTSLAVANLPIADLPLASPRPIGGSRGSSGPGEGLGRGARGSHGVEASALRQLRTAQSGPDTRPELTEYVEPRAGSPPS